MIAMDNDMLKILRYIYKKHELIFEDICVKFKKIPDIKHRLNLLKNNGYIYFETYTTGGGKTHPKVYRVPNAKVICTYLGNRTVQDHFLFTREYWVRSVFTPIAVSIATTLLLNGIIWLSRLIP